VKARSSGGRFAGRMALAAQTNMHVAARRFGIGVPRMSDLRHGRIERFSVERLIRILATVDRRVDVTVVATTTRFIPWFVGLTPRARPRMTAAPPMTRPRRIRRATLPPCRHGV